MKNGTQVLVSLLHLSLEIFFGFCSTSVLIVNTQKEQAELNWGWERLEEKRREGAYLK